MTFEPLVLALRGFFGKSLTELPPEKRDRVKRVLALRGWDSFAVGKRIRLAATWDFENNPESKSERDRVNQLLDEYYTEREELRHQIAGWETVEALTASDKAIKDDRLRPLRARIAQLEAEHERVRNGDTRAESVARPTLGGSAIPPPDRDGADKVATAASEGPNRDNWEDDKSAGKWKELAELFDPVPVSALAAMFPTRGKANFSLDMGSDAFSESRWKRWAEHASANGLIRARVAWAKFNPFIAGYWFLKQGEPGWTEARLLRVLAKHLPLRSADKRDLLNLAAEE
jgi:hypothetical protein